MTGAAEPWSVGPGQFEAEKHYYPRVLNAHLHPLVSHFLGLSNERILQRYCHLHPEVPYRAVEQLLRYEPQYFRWGGSDLLHVTTEAGERHMVVIETNSCPSGQKSMPRLEEQVAGAGYRLLLQRAFLPMLTGTAKGELAVLYDKNLMECSGYAAVLADLTGERVHIVPCPELGEQHHRWRHGVLEVRAAKRWVAIRGALRYVTQRPWTRIPPLTRTVIFNPVVACLAGGRNKLLAAKAYATHNRTSTKHGFGIRTPETICDVAHHEVPTWVRHLGGLAVIKVPYSNAGQGVYTITSRTELAAFMARRFEYDRFIVQALIGNLGWRSTSRLGRLYHVGTVPNHHHELFAADLRFMVGADASGFFPVAIYARRARSPLPDAAPKTNSWDVLGTNLSVKVNGNWDSETERLIASDSRNFNRLGLGLDDLIEAYIQTTQAVTAIDRMAKTLMSGDGTFRRRRFQTLNPDPALLREIRRSS